MPLPTWPFPQSRSISSGVEKRNPSKHYVSPGTCHLINRKKDTNQKKYADIQSDLHRSKRRFTDFIFQRVRIDNGALQASSTLSTSPASHTQVNRSQRTLRTPRSVNNLRFTSRTPTTAATANASEKADSGIGATNANGVPLVRATSPGAEIREERRLAAARKEKDEAMKRALYSQPSVESTKGSSIVPTTTIPSNSTRFGPGSGRHVRKFQISRSSALRNPLRAGVEGGVQKKRPAGEAGKPGVAVLVEKLSGQPQSKKIKAGLDTSKLLTEQQKPISVPVPPAPHHPEQQERQRKRPVVNRAERQWREANKATMSASRQHIFETLDRDAQKNNKGTWENESEDLARQFEQIALELEGNSNDIVGENETTKETSTLSSTQSPSLQSTRLSSSLPKPPLKYPPRVPNRHMANRDINQMQGITKTTTATTEQEQLEGNEKIEDEDEEEEAEEESMDYVYDTYIRRPLLPESPSQTQNDKTPSLPDHPLNSPLGNPPSSELEPQESTTNKVGVIVIDPEDEEYWEHFIEDDDDDEKWDSEDADSNGKFVYTTKY